MNTTYGLRNLAVAISFGAIVAMSGCGGGSGTRPDAEGAAATGGATGTTGGAPSMPSGAAGSLAALLPNASNAFTPLVQAFRGNATGQTAELASSFSVESVSSDGNNGFRVTYTVDGQEETIHFEATDYLDGEYYYSKDVDGTEYFFGTYTDSFERTDKNQGSSGFRYFDVTTFGADDACNEDHRPELHVVRRFEPIARTFRPALRLLWVSRTASFFSQGQRLQRPPVENQRQLASDRGLRRQHADGSDSRDSREERRSRRRLVLARYRLFRYQQRADCRRQIHGRPGRRGIRRVRAPRRMNPCGDYEGTVDGQFYGPAAEEVAGVFNASRTDRVMAGVFGASRLEPRVSGQRL